MTSQWAATAGAESMKRNWSAPAHAVDKPIHLARSRSVTHYSCRREKKKHFFQKRRQRNWCVASAVWDSVSRNGIWRTHRNSLTLLRWQRLNFHQCARWGVESPSPSGEKKGRRGEKHLLARVCVSNPRRIDRRRDGASSLPFISRLPQKRPRQDNPLSIFLLLLQKYLDKYKRRKSRSLRSTLCGFSRN